MINKVILMGRLTADPDIRQTQSGTAVAKFTVAINRQYTDKQTGERKADFINVTAWRNTAEFISKYFHKGSMVIVEGEIQNNDYTDKNGVKHYSMVVKADSVTFGESKSASGGQAQPQGQPQQYYAPPANTSQHNYVAQPDVYQQYQAPPQKLDMSEFNNLEDGDLPF